MAVNIRKKKSMLRTTLEQEKKATKRDPEGAASVKKKAATIGNVIMNLSVGAAIPALLRNITPTVMKQLSTKQVAKLKKIKLKELQGKAKKQAKVNKDKVKKKEKVDKQFEDYVKDDDIDDLVGEGRAWRLAKKRAQIRANNPR